MINRIWWKKIILAYSETRILYRFIQGLSIFLILSTIILIGFGIWNKNKLELQKNLLFGSWDVVFLDVGEENISYFTQHAFIQDYFIQCIQRCIDLENDNKIVIGSVDDRFLDLSNTKMLSGRLPIVDGEVAVERKYLSVLGINKVGDVIPFNEKIKPLVGYKLCGIVENYSERWNKVNWDVKYINCFILNASENEFNVFVSASDNVINDINLNMLEYRYNTIQKNNKFVEKILSFWILVWIIIIIIILRIRKIIFLKIKLLHFNDKSKKSCDLNKLMSILIPILCITFSIIFNMAINNIFFETHYSENQHINIIKNNNTNKKMLLMNYAKLKYLKYYNQKHLVIMFYTGKEYETLYTFSILICWLILLDFILLNVYTNYIKYQNATNNKIILYKYYFGSNKILLEQRKIILKYFLVENTIIIILYLVFKLDVLYNNNLEVIKQLSIIIILNFCHSIIRYYIVNKLIQKIKINLL